MGKDAWTSIKETAKTMSFELETLVLGKYRNLTE